MAQPILQLITRADDAGLNVATNEGARLAIEQGVIRNVSVLAVAAGLDDAVDRLKGLEVCFGFHACLNSEWFAPRWAPLTRAATLGDASGMLPANWAELAALNPRASEVVDELAAQLRRLRATGLPIRYMDEHMYFSYAIPALRPAIAEFARSEGLIYRMELPCLPLLADGRGDPGDPDRFLKRLSEAPRGRWLEIWHPARDTQEMRVLHKPGQAPGLVADERAAELALVTHPLVAAACSAGSVKLIRYDEL